MFYTANWIITHWLVFLAREWALKCLTNQSCSSLAETISSLFNYWTDKKMLTTVLKIVFQENNLEDLIVKKGWSLVSFLCLKGSKMEYFGGFGGFGWTKTGFSESEFWLWLNPKISFITYENYATEVHRNSLPTTQLQKSQGRRRY